MSLITEKGALIRGYSRTSRRSGEARYVSRPLYVIRLSIFCYLSGAEAPMLTKRKSSLCGEQDAKKRLIRLHPENLSLYVLGREVNLTTHLNYSLFSIALRILSAARLAAGELSRSIW